MIRYRFLLAALALVCLATVGTPAEDTPRKDDRGDKASTTKGTYMGRIVRVDNDKRTLVLGEITERDGKRTGTGSGTGTGTGTGTEKPGTGTAGGDRTGKGTAADRTMTFTLNDKARISLDGKEATFRDLKMGLYARVHTGSGTSGSTGGTKDKSTTGGTAADRDKTGSGSTGRMMTATRIEAFSKAPARTGTGSGAGTGKRDTDR